MSKSIVTLKSAIVSGDVAVLATKLTDLAIAAGGDDAVAIVQKMGLNFSLAVKSAKEQVKTRQKEAAEQKEANKVARLAKLNDTLAARKVQREAENAAELANRKAEAEAMLKDIVEKMGLDLEVAQGMVETAMAKKYPAKAEKSFTFNRVAIDYKGEQYDMPTSGNMPNVWKERVADEFGDDRSGFIMEYAVDKEAAKAILEEKNGVNA